MKKGGIGGGSTITGLNFENKVDFLTLLEKIPSYRVEKSADKAGHEIYHYDQPVARCFKKLAFYKFLDEEKVEMEEHGFQKTSSR